MTTLTIHYKNRADLLTQLDSIYLENRTWLTCKELRYRYKLSSSSTMTHRLIRWQAQGKLKLDSPQSVKRGPTGRILSLKLTPQLKSLMEGLK